MDVPGRKEAGGTPQLRHILFAGRGTELEAEGRWTERKEYQGKKKTLTWAQTPTGVVASVERNTNDRSGEGLKKKKGRAEGDNEAVGVERM